MRSFRIALVVFVVAATLAGIARREIAGLFRVPALLVAPPDAHLAMPLHELNPLRVANTWHAARSGGRRHEGQDLFAPRGTPVYSATHGVVIKIGTDHLGGNVVSVLGSGGRVYYYAHLSRFAEGLRVMDEVTPETVLGYVGNTGNARATPPHLHFSVYGRDGAINPLPLLRNS